MQHFTSPAFGPGMGAMGFGGIPFFLIMILLAWTLVWKGFALWYAARNDQKVWYVVMLILSTLGILEIIYLLFFRADKRKNVVLVETPNTTIVEEVIIQE